MEGARRMRALLLLSFLFSSLAQALAESSRCCAIQRVTNAPAELLELNGVYTLKGHGAKRADICIDGCVYVKDNDEYCFAATTSAEGADVVCQV